MPALRLAFARCLAAAPLMLVAACAHRGATQGPATPPPLVRYVAPAPPQDAARLTMHGDVPPGWTYTVDVLADTLTCRGPQRVGSSAGSVDLPATALATERWQTLQVAIDEPLTRRVCTVRLSFTPRHGRAYLLKPRLADNHCNALVFDATDPQAPQLEPSFRHRMSSSEDCVPLARAEGARVGRMPRESVSVQDLPTNPDPDALSARRAPTKAPASGPRPDDAVTDGDLTGLTGH